jgi:hypothetical protein
VDLVCLLLREAQGFAVRIFALLFLCALGVYGYGLPMLVI